jgi:hypothetical protein
MNRGGCSGGGNLRRNPVSVGVLRCVAVPQCREVDVRDDEARRIGVSTGRDTQLERGASGHGHHRHHQSN